MKPTTSASASSVKSTLSSVPATCDDRANNELLGRLLKDLQRCAKRINWQKGSKLNSDECDDAVQVILLEFDKRNKEGLYDESRQTPIGYMYRQLQGEIDKRIRENEKVRYAESYYAETEEVADEMFIPADEIRRYKDAYQRKLYSIIWEELSESDRKIVELLEKGFSNQKIAEIMGISYGACTKRIHDMRKRLKTKLYQQGFRGLLARV